jgi:DNA replication protein DnaC
MGCSSEISELARRRLDELRSHHRDKISIIKEQIFIKAPQARIIEKEIAQTSLMIARTVLSGSNVSDNINKIRTFNLKKQEQLRRILSDAGFACDALDSPYYCSICNDTGVYKTKVCDCVRRAERDLLLERLDASCFHGGKFSNFRLDYYEKTPSNEFSPFDIMKKAYDTCVKYSETFSLRSPSLLLSGGPGLGKTHLSVSIARAVIEKGFDVFYASFQILLTHLESYRFGNRDNDYLDCLSTPLNCELLLLDDLGSEFTSPFGTSVLYQIVNNRLLKGLPTIINTNLNHNELIRRYSERVGSRLLGHYEMVLFAGEDVRLQKMFPKR